MKLYEDSNFTINDMDKIVDRFGIEAADSLKPYIFYTIGREGYIDDTQRKPWEDRAQKLKNNDKNETLYDDLAEMKGMRTGDK
jgi:hypothetical protein